MCDVPGEYDPLDMREQMVLHFERGIHARNQYILRKWVLPEKCLTRKREAAKNLLTGESISALVWLYRHGNRIADPEIRLLHSLVVDWWDWWMGARVWPLIPEYQRILNAKRRAWQIERLQGK